ncbi:hypothetical protein [Methylobacterium sp. R2-1]|uniref:hypothetical protein n=1 Tax=Methylobacterium sp. R2-1 TaxID=2587064 RepID=UPI0016168C69|nr:hypothetical protein [Methylobacterium sp. R2-1]MBB2964351.1 hypothetical protein [Methylobacterium sp. R2-1]
MHVALILACLTLVAQAQPMRGVPLAIESWWVVLGSFDNSGGSGSRAADASVARTRRQAQTCGERPVNDLSEKSSGFVPGFDVSVLGAYPTRAGRDRLVPSRFLRTVSLSPACAICR